jgi:alpha/beta superfamily hydrolase
VGAKDSDTSLSVVGNLEARLRGLGDAVDTRYYWDEGHGANTDAAAFIDWIKALPA